MPVLLNKELVTHKVLLGSGPDSPATEIIPSNLQVLDITVYKELDKIPYACLRIVDGSASESDFILGNSGLFNPGKSIDIQLGYNSSDLSVFSGQIINNSHTVNGRQSTLNLTCKHQSVKMTISKNFRHFNDLSDEDIVENLFQENGITELDFESFGSVHEQLVQANVSDWDFALSRIDSNGMVCNISDSVNVFKPDPSQDPKVTLVYGENILAFRTESDIRSQSASVKAFSWDYANQSVNESEGNPFLNAAPGNISEAILADSHGREFKIKTPVMLDNQTLQVLADTKKQKQSLSKIKGKVKFYGTADLNPGDWILLEGVGDQFSGKAFVSALQHNCNNGNWVTEATIGWNEDFYSEKFNPFSPSAENGQFSKMPGLQIGIVTDILDPKGEGRVRVSLPVINPDDAGIWARVATLDAGNNRGTFFRPEIGDEVIIGFMNGDSSHPVILGMLHSSSNPTPFEPEDSNDQKGYVSRSEIKITINDGDKSIIIETPGGRIISLDDNAGEINIKDDNGNSIKMDSSGITIDSPKEININAGSALNLAAPEIGIKADMAASFEASGSMSVKSDGTAEIKGAMVDIQGSLVKIN
ncbi:type VI secretion system tip protein VgrG [Aquiflexum sp.]|uniref:type VI secretion system tip protein VgrG n=1 Tax=Aquiflexum sp. TaxID=1872584 RepID=UPI0035936220